MKFKGVLFAIVLKFLCVENRMIPINYVTLTPLPDDSTLTAGNQNQYEGNVNEKVIGLKNFEESEDFFEMDRRRSKDKTKKPCAIVVLSNIQNPNMQSLLRKYRYDANGMLIPSSVQYFIKLPQGLRRSPVLVPLNDKAFSPLGGFVRYYKEVPPIPQIWKR